LTRRDKPRITNCKRRWTSAALARMWRRSRRGIDTRTLTGNDEDRHARNHKPKDALASSRIAAGQACNALPRDVEIDALKQINELKELTLSRLS
jgi:hypothetical protein